MNKLLVVLATVFALSACSSAVVSNGVKDQLIGEGKIVECKVVVSSNFKGHLSYNSGDCAVELTQ